MEARTWLLKTTADHSQSESEDLKGVIVKEREEDGIKISSIEITEEGTKR